MGRSNRSDRIISKRGTLLYPNIFTPKPADPMNGKKESYSMVILFPKNTDLSAERKIVEELAVKEWGRSIEKIKNFKHPILDGDLNTDENNEPRKYFTGKTYMNLSSLFQPQVLDSNKKKIGEDRKNELYAGCEVMVSMIAYTYGGPSDSNKGDKKPGINFGLGNIIKVADGERLGGSTSAEDDFADLDLGTTAINLSDLEDDEIPF